MKNTLRTTLAIISAAMFLLNGGTHVLAASDYGLGDTANSAGIGVRQGYGQTVPVVIGNVIGTGLSMIGVLFFILMVYGGFLWMTAHGNEDQTGKAFSTIIAATIGIIIVMAAYAITNYVMSSVTVGKACANAADTSCGAGSTCVADVGNANSFHCK